MNNKPNILVIGAETPPPGANNDCQMVIEPDLTAGISVLKKEDHQIDLVILNPETGSLHYDLFDAYQLIRATSEAIPVLMAITNDTSVPDDVDNIDVWALVLGEPDNEKNEGFPGILADALKQTETA